MKAISSDEFPVTLALIQSLGGTDVERAAELDVKTPKTVERMRKRLPAQMWPFLRSRHAPRLLRALLEDLEQVA
jgi:hypothetical protein